MPKLMDALGYAEHILRQLKRFPSRNPQIEISVLKNKMIDGYDDLLQSLGVDVEKASYEEEKILEEIECFYEGANDADEP